MNNEIFYFFYNLAHQSTIFDSVIVFFAFYFPYVVIILAGVFLLMHHDVLKAENPYQVFLEKKKEILKAFFAGILAWLLAQVLKFLFSLGRPAEALAGINPLLSKSDYSFPSGHATFFAALAVSIFFFHKKAGYLFILFALLIGVARVIAGVHFPVDILGGFALGALIAYFVRNV
ncbi:hypothetical protein A3I95_00835 [Candidatus Nomurabacteria bacterium RIFCSPLOWO2_02_FULL_44_12]|uniref:Phosphatidic acid phosphatase type 2/haloperoxidase domain-containing protein n=1 Tax=Candidatus Nomurabacteria bacterium RIFCSPLOWO2_12_FULL_44_11 TaxID=1801796 RepID=A0A1F6Y2Z8_9BACT|nr:MAG: hypothetical protein A3E95_00840 [Candidatus Nomurabacteria bacterium RIFCSPHIGHO2_12_FULL_44_22b]OGJ00712.1 MAG: hypothetical protein A3G53_00735 [Candidatus Nomurabacteria bacterium RIFCSPLOWO2_12_FULL_44_11]OGJ06927.1 MAG: hypothetical protein A3I95_00835 [Candidatus Nomurabacteria bacterium RIFCSPLOWO2_02_FULL_44_12]